MDHQSAGDGLVPGLLPGIAAGAGGRAGVADGRNLRRSAAPLAPVAR